MKNKIILFLALFAMFILTSCQKQEETLNLYGVQETNASKTTPQAYLAFFVIATIVIIVIMWFYKKITKK